MHMYVCYRMHVKVCILMINTDNHTVNTFMGSIPWLWILRISCILLMTHWKDEKERERNNGTTGFDMVKQLDDMTFTAVVFLFCPWLVLSFIKSTTVFIGPMFSFANIILCVFILYLTHRWWFKYHGACSHVILNIQIWIFSMYKCIFF